MSHFALSSLLVALLTAVSCPSVEPKPIDVRTGDMARHAGDHWPDRQAQMQLALHYQHLTEDEMQTLARGLLSPHKTPPPQPPHTRPKSETEERLTTYHGSKYNSDDFAIAVPRETNFQKPSSAIIRDGSAYKMTGRELRSAIDLQSAHSGGGHSSLSRAGHRLRRQQQLTDEQQTTYDNSLDNYLSRGNYSLHDTATDQQQQEEEAHLAEAEQQLTEEQQNSLDNSLANYFSRP